VKAKSYTFREDQKRMPATADNIGKKDFDLDGSCFF